ncbi:MAG: hypothetical protein FJ098_16200 [Deltaproteobacteria bacterium]|nr:hypothetical protein [Deltaproteobacteria bacterium]
MARACTLVLLLLVSAPAGAEDPPPPAQPPEAAAPMSPGFRTAMGGQVGVGMIGEDLFVNLSVGSTFAFGKIAFGIHAPLRLRAWDRPPGDRGVIREEDWDEWRDYFRILRFFQYGTPEEPVYVRAGELAAASVGHGTIVHRYYNNLDLDHFSLGLDTRVSFRPAGGEVLVNDLLNPEVLALRGFLRPLTLWDHGKGEILDRFTVGLTWAGDVQAPWRLRTTGEGDAEAPRVDRAGNLSYERRVASLWGLDLGWTVVKTEIFDLTPFMDFNALAAKGFGWHPGVLMTVRPAEKTVIEMRFEYRALSPRYAPTYFNSFYDFQRTETFPEAGAGPWDHALWRHWVEGSGHHHWRHGFLGEIYAALFGVIGIGGLYEDYTGRNNSNVMIRMDFPYVANLKLDVYYAKRNFNRFVELFDRDGAWFVAEARYRFIQWMYVFATYSLHWQMVKDRDSPRFGRYDALDDFQAGLGVELAF